MLIFFLLISDGQWCELGDFVDIAILVREIRASNWIVPYLPVKYKCHSITKWTRREGEGVSRNSRLGHVTKGRCHAKCPQLST